MRKNSTRIVLVAGLMFWCTHVFAAIFTVTSSADSGPGTLRQAIIDANANPDFDEIRFNLPPPAPPFFFPPSVVLTSALPEIVNPVLIDGYTQPGSVRGPLQAITRVLQVILYAASGQPGIAINAGGVGVTGLAIVNASIGIDIRILGGVGSPVRIYSNHIGTLNTGALPINPFPPFAFNNQVGIAIAGESAVPPAPIYAVPRVIIGTDGDGVNDANEGNQISSNLISGIEVREANNCVIAGNFIGTTIIGGASPGFGNGTGLLLDGLDAGDGATLNRVGTNGDGVSDALERNVVSNNLTNGISLIRKANQNSVAGNFVGLSLDGFPAGNGINGINVTQGNDNIFGVSPTGGVAAQANFIGSNVQNGISITSFDIGSPSNGNSIMGNTIGANEGGTARGNGGWGVLLFHQGTGTVDQGFVGSNDDGTNDALEANRIVNNAKDGIAVRAPATGPGSTRLNRISRNIYGGNTGNAPLDGQGFGLSINLQNVASDGITVNDPGDGDVGGNDLYNYPEFSFFGVDAENARFIGTAPAGSIVQLYRATSVADAAIGNPSYREGASFLGNFVEGGPDDQDPAPGAFLFFIPQTSFSSPILVGDEVIATAISAASGPANTSEFSQVTLSLLPVRFVSFDAQLQGEKVLVSWATAQEQNASHFEVQKSTNGTTFQTIGSVNARGNSSTLVNYSFIDNSVAPGVSYYRLRQVDLDGKFVYTKVVTIRNQGKGTAFYAWPNPVNDVLNLTLTQTKPERLQIRVVDMNGRTMRSNEFNTVRGLNQVSLNFSSLPRGMYVIQVTGGETILTQKIMKN